MLPRVNYALGEFQGGGARCGVDYDDDDDDDDLTMMMMMTMHAFTSTTTTTTTTTNTITTAAAAAATAANTTTAAASAVCRPHARMLAHMLCTPRLALPACQCMHASAASPLSLPPSSLLPSLARVCVCPSLPLSLIPLLLPLMWFCVLPCPHAIACMLTPMLCSLALPCPHTYACSALTTPHASCRADGTPRLGCRAYGNPSAVSI